jgi:hypothetical protein
MRRGTQDVGVVMLDALAGHVGVMAVGCSNVRELVGCRHLDAPLCVREGDDGPGIRSAGGRCHPSNDRALDVLGPSDRNLGPSQ